MRSGKDELPLGFAMSLAENTPALKRFGAMSPAEQNLWVERSRHVRSRQEMQRLVADLGRNS